MIIAIILLVTAGLLGWVTVRLMRRLSPPVAGSPAIGEFARQIRQEFPEPCFHAQIGKVISDGRVDAMRSFGADRFLTFLPMPDGTCWSLTVVHHPDEASAKASYSRVPARTH